MILLGCALALSAARVLQYPLSVTFPIGGDAADYVTAAQTLLATPRHPQAAAALLRQSWYPVSLITFTASAALPLKWPDRFTWTMAAAHFTVGLALAALAARFGGIPAAAAAILFWSLTTTGMTRFFEDGTLAQLMSLGFAALFLERLAAGATIGSIAALILALGAHPITAAALLLALLTAAPSLLYLQRNLPSAQRRQTRATIIAALTIATAAIISGKSPLNARVDISTDSPLDLSLAALPLVALTPFGLLQILRTVTVPLTARFILLAFTVVSLLLAGNLYVGIGIWTDRLRSLAAAAIVVTASVAAPRLITAAFSSQLARTAFIVTALLPLYIVTWHSSAKVYRYYENQNNVARLHPQEYEAFQWVARHVPADATVYSVANNRHIEWLPPLSGHPYIPIADWKLFTGKIPPGYVVILNTWDEPPPAVTHNPRLQQQFANERASIYEMVP
ncbi:MAG: hypothetical protein COT71_03045 [Candidatus Andersenbacteria bacterium CG10_big_fil_rev_8_21_14_0_10_54_11]|uniref:Glycosyltransferase RgtA/B/C/D-like domain-containing protein n=1 Tax=Candidatus Andersenbacteria bacterium CG10_big_fil_rev_8_21_14_0_10_54_11 TaxID=1974485 RepID=A0A2M6WZ24_9BACT|nr:MAG: hypothetical protein COT71_03045 [Candidatus Andersenbacteria bacterium CG10_big_fil_rev_8_21_14_0_10_54_11]